MKQIHKIMAITQNPFTGRSRGKFATAVFSKQFGKNTMRSKPLQVANPRTQKQMEQRTKFSLMVELSRMFLPFIKTSFKQVAVGMSEFNMFMKTNIGNVITGTYPDYTIDFTQLIVAKGTLTGVENGAAVAGAGHLVNYTWDDNTGVADALATDKAMALVINYDKGAVAQDLTTTTRADGSLALVVPSDWVGDSVEVYLAFMTEAKDKISDSTFLGEKTIVA